MTRSSRVPVRECFQAGYRGGRDLSVAFSVFRAAIGAALDEGGDDAFFDVGIVHRAEHFVSAGFVEEPDDRAVVCRDYGHAPHGIFDLFGRQLGLSKGCFEVLVARDGLGVHGHVVFLAQGRVFLEGVLGIVWLAWARWLEWDNLASGSSLLQAAFRPEFHSALKTFETWRWQHLPDGTSLRPWREYAFPSQLLRRLHDSQELPPSLIILPVNWIDEAVARVLETFGDYPGRRIRLREHVEERLAAGLDKEECRMALERISHLDFADDPIIRQEIDEALLVVRADLAAIFTDFGRWLPEPEEFQAAPTQSVAIEDIMNCWDVATAREEFTLAGWMGRLIFPPDLAGDDQAQAALLRTADTNQSKAAWFGLFCMGSLLGARCRPIVIREFWESQLVPRGTLAENQKASELARILDDVSHQKFMTLDAAGEAAELWRRVFYDFQKLRIFVFEDSLPTVLGEYIELAERPDDVIMFLKSGKLADGERWKGVIGQSMTAPLLWIVESFEGLVSFRTLVSIQHAYTQMRPFAG